MMGWLPPFPTARARQFSRDESGVMVAFAIFFFLIILMMVGIGVDLMRFEMERTRLQNTLDRAVLAAADLDQERAPADVVRDYFAKAHLNATLDAPSVNQGLGHREVGATAQMNVDTQFMHMMGINSLIAPAAATAAEAVQDIEVALVLDMSNSMNENNRLVNLKPAAHEFVDTVLAMSQAGNVAISIVPYNSQVNAGETLFDLYNSTDDHAYSHCLNFERADYGASGLSTTTQFDQASHLDPFSNDAQAASFPPLGTSLPNPVCPTAAGTEITVMSNDAAALHDKIDALTAYGNTSIEIGMKWASALLDPGSRGVVSQLIASGEVDARNAGRPLAFGESQALKVIVVMTDGANTNQYELRDDLQTGTSNIWYHPPSQTFSVWDAGRGRFYWPSQRVWRDRPYGGEVGQPGFGAAVNLLSNQELYATAAVATVARDIMTPYYQATGRSASQAWNDWYWGAFETAVGPTEKDTRLENICDAVKAQNVLVYSIGFEAPSRGEAELRYCASTPGHFFDVNGLEIRDAFQAIARSIATLRLTQ